MKKIWKKLLAGMVCACLLCGCGGGAEKEKAVDEPEETVEEEVEAVTEEAEEAELPEEDLLADYTTVEGLRMEKGDRIAVVAKDIDLGYWSTVKAGIEQAVADLNEYLGYKGDDQVTVTFEGPKSGEGVDTQVNILDAVIAENPTVLCLAAVDMNSCMAQLEAAEEDGIPVVILDSGVTSDDLVYSVVATDNESAGAEAAKQLCEAIGDEGQVAILSHYKESENSVQRVNGFKKEIEKNHPDVTVVSVVYEPSTDSDPTVEEQVETVLTNYPELKGYFCTNESVSEAMLSVLNGYEERGIQMVGFDMGSVQAQAIRDGKELGAVAQNPFGMGYATVIAGIRASLEMENDDYIDSGYQWIDADNIDLEENALYIYE